MFLKAAFQSWTGDLFPGLLTWLRALSVTGFIKSLLCSLSTVQLTKWVHLPHNEAVRDMIGQSTGKTWWDTGLSTWTWHPVPCAVSDWSQDPAHTPVTVSTWGSEDQEAGLSEALPKAAYCSFESKPADVFMSALCQRGHSVLTDDEFLFITGL